MDDHALDNRTVAGRNHSRFPFYFNGTDAAGGNFVELLEVAQMGMMIPADLAASRMVVPSATRTV